MSGVLRLAVLAVISMLVSMPVLAQEVPVVFSHGLASTGETWEQAAGALEQQLEIQAHRPTTSWWEQYQVQASQLHGAVGSLSGSTIAIGHSNGGIVAREWSKLRSLDGVITLGSPNQGAPLAHNLARWAGYVEDVDSALWWAFNNFSACQSSNCEWSWIPYQDGLAEIMSAVLGRVVQSLPRLVATVGIDLGAPVVPQMSPQSSYIQALNSSGNLSREASAIGTRVGIVSVAHNYFHAGAFRAVWPEEADTIDFWKDAAIAMLDYLAFQVYSGASDDESRALADSMWNAAGFLNGLDYFWCETVSAVGSDTCYANDTILPEWTQRYPGAIELHTGSEGSAHIREIAENDALLYQALTYHMSVPPRDTGDGGGGASGQMHVDSAVRGCSDWTWWDPVYQPSADACLGYCGQNGADACEWSDNGDCYVEFGSGCGIEGGYGGWSAAVLSGGGSGGGGGGGGSHQMQADSAVRGCEDWTWWDPVYQPDPASCAAYCAQNGADACEWSESGECYVEFGGGCHVESYPGWWAVVLQ